MGLDAGGLLGSGYLLGACCGYLSIRPAYCSCTAVPPSLVLEKEHASHCTSRACYTVVGLLYCALCPCMSCLGFLVSLCIRGVADLVTSLQLVTTKKPIVAVLASRLVFAAYGLARCIARG